MFRKPRNTCIVFDHEGEEIASYSKCHLFTPGAEEGQFYPGDALGIFSLAGVSFGIAICYDLRFSGLFNVYAEAGVCCMMVPAAWPAFRIDHWELSIRAQALEHQFYVIGVNTTGLNPVDGYAGRSLAADPSGTVIARAGQGEELMVAGIDPDAMVHLREALPVSRDRDRNCISGCMTGRESPDQLSVLDVYMSDDRPDLEHVSPHLRALRPVISSR